MEKNKVVQGVRKGAWTKQEDSLLRKCIEKYGEGKWHLVPLRAGLNRCRKSCRLRWLNYLRPNLKRGIFDNDEVDLIVRLHNLLGNRWSLIAGRIPGRTGNDIKNFWNTHFDRKKSLPPPAAATTGESSKRAAGGKTITKSTIIRPQPRTFFSNCLSDQLMTKANETIIDNENPIIKKNQSDSLLLQEEAEEDDQLNECIRWWGNLLEITENGSDPGEAPPFMEPAFGDNDHDINLDADDVWEFLNFEY